MNKHVFFFCLLLMCSQFISCDKYHDKDNELVGKWMLVSTSGGFSGVGYNPNFDQLNIDKDLVFEIFSQTEILARGHIIYVEHMQFENYIELIEDESFTMERIEILSDNQKEAQVSEDTLDLRYLIVVTDIILDLKGLGSNGLKRSNFLNFTTC